MKVSVDEEGGGGGSATCVPVMGAITILDGTRDTGERAVESNTLFKGGASFFLKKVVSITKKEPLHQRGKKNKKKTERKSHTRVELL